MKLPLTPDGQWPRTVKVVLVHSYGPQNNIYIYIYLVDLFPLSLARSPSSPGSFQGSLSLYLKFRIKNLINNLRC